MDIELLIEDFQAKLRENGVETSSRMTLNEDGEIVAMKFEVTERYE